MKLVTLQRGHQWVFHIMSMLKCQNLQTKFCFTFFLAEYILEANFGKLIFKVSQFSFQIFVPKLFQIFTNCFKLHTFTFSP